MSPHLRKEGKDCVGSQAATRWRTGAGTFGLHESETLQSVENQKKSWWPADANLRASQVEHFSQIPAFQPSSHANLWQASSWGWSNKGDLILWHSRKELVIERRETGFDYFTGTPQWSQLSAFTLVAREAEKRFLLQWVSDESFLSQNQQNIPASTSRATGTRRPSKVVPAWEIWRGLPSFAGGLA